MSLRADEVVALAVAVGAAQPLIRPFYRIVPRSADGRISFLNLLSF